jgi:hypothetical protein
VNDGKLLELSQRLRREFIRGAEDEWVRITGRTMTVEDLERVLRRYPGDWIASDPRF